MTTIEELPDKMVAYHYINGTDEVQELSLSAKSMKAIYKKVTGGELSEEVAQTIAADMAKEVFEILETVETYAYHNRSDEITEADVYHALKNDAKYANDILFDLKKAHAYTRLPANLGAGQEQAPTADTSDSAVTAGESLTEYRTTGWQHEETVQLQPPTQCPLTQEEQVFFRRVITVCFAQDEDERVKALKSLEVDPSLEFILPQLTTSMADGINTGLFNKITDLCFVVLRMAKALVKNRSITFDQHFHLILPGILSCILMQEAFEEDDIEGDELHWDLREFASELLGDMVRVAKNYNLIGRIINMLIKGIRDHENVFTIFGAVIGFGQLGSLVVADYLLPELSNLSEFLYAGGRDPKLAKGAIMKTWCRLVKITAPVVKALTYSTDPIAKYVELYGRFGEALFFVVLGIRGREQETAAKLLVNLVLKSKKNHKCQEGPTAELMEREQNSDCEKVNAATGVAQVEECEVDVLFSEGVKINANSKKKNSNKAKV
ncbi:transcription initiation factor TFIID subunit 6-like [Drosophila obscura]|uniref:transcription initiation factor TFIID subunit 6-like n=1 Tax=Drosophila obscura TaxID=7282 RepID=UPI001BB16E69|nr:transcription initiation factor TFIID subunit 6-like [Drosophila obscura]